MTTTVFAAVILAALATAGCVNEAAIQTPPATWTYKQKPDAATDGAMHATTGPQARYGQNGTEFQPTLGGNGGYQGVTRESLRGITEPRRVKAEAGTGSAPGAQRPSSSFDLEQSQLKSSGAPSKPAASSLPPDPRDKPRPAGAPDAIAPGAVVGGQGAGAASSSGPGAASSGGGANGAPGRGVAAGPAMSPGASPGTSPVIGTRAGATGGGATGGGATGTGRP